MSSVLEEFRTVTRERLAAGHPVETELELPEALGGAGAGFAEVAVVLEELGRAAAAGPYLGATVLGVGTLLALEPGPVRDEWLRAPRPVAVLTDGDDDTLGTGPPFTLAGGRLRGRAGFVPDPAERFLLLARDETGRPVVVGVGRERLEVVERPVLDETRRFATVSAEVSVEDSAVLRFADDAEAAASRLLDRGALAVACDSLGLSAGMLDATVAYAKQREQFGRPIGSFQAVKHACADMLVHVSVARQLVDSALATLDPRAVSMAKSYACDTAVDVVGKAMQLHGGIGYTWEAGIHAYFKRATLNRSLFGSSTAHRRRLMAREFRAGRTASLAG